MLTAQELAHILSHFDTDMDKARAIDIINDLEKTYHWDHYVPPYQFPPYPYFPQPFTVWTSTTAGTIGSTVANGDCVAWNPEAQVTYTST